MHRTGTKHIVRYMQLLMEKWDVPLVASKHGNNICPVLVLSELLLHLLPSASLSTPLFAWSIGADIAWQSFP